MAKNTKKTKPTGPKRAVSTKHPKTRDGSPEPSQSLPARKKTKSAGQQRLGLRGVTPWAARHAAKHAAEAEARNAEPPLPGSARATLRVPAGAEELKTRIAQLHHAVERIRSLRKNLSDTFYDVAIELQQIQQMGLHEAKGYASFESFVDREIDLGKAVALKLVRVPGVFRENAARHYGMDALLAALGALDNTSKRAPPAAGQSGHAALPMKPPSSNR